VRDCPSMLHAKSTVASFEFRLRRSQTTTVARAQHDGRLAYGARSGAPSPGRRRRRWDSTASTKDALASVDRQLVSNNPSHSSRCLTTSQVVRPVVDRDEA
jgi:hypothetical protein